MRIFLLLLLCLTFGPPTFAEIPTHEMRAMEAVAWAIWPEDSIKLRRTLIRNVAGDFENRDDAFRLNQIHRLADAVASALHRARDGKPDVNDLRVIVRNTLRAHQLAAVRGPHAANAVTFVGLSVVGFYLLVDGGLRFVQILPEATPYEGIRDMAGAATTFLAAISYAKLNPKWTVPGTRWLGWKFDRTPYLATFGSTLSQNFKNDPAWIDGTRDGATRVENLMPGLVSLIHAHYGHEMRLAACESLLRD